MSSTWVVGQFGPEGLDLTGPLCARPLPCPPYRPYPPVKQQQYAKAMTVCIALSCREDDELRIVLCMDSRLDETYSSTDSANKVDAIGHNWFALISGDDWIMANELSRFIGKNFAEAPCPTEREEPFTIIKQATSDFQSSPFCTASHRVDLIVGGFIGEEPMLMYTGYADGQPYTALSGDMAVIGSGSSIATAFLKIRKYGPMSSVRRALYIAYEAKKYSENAPSVGPKTALAVLFPSGKTRTFGHKYNDRLEESRRKFGLQPIDLGALPDPRYPTNGQSPLPPLPESPGGSDVS